MEATYCIGNDVDVCRMFDQYLYKRNENLDLSLSVAHGIHNNHYSNNNMNNNDQTFHTPSFGDEDFDIPQINPLHGQNQPQPQAYHNSMSMDSMNHQSQDSISLNDMSNYTPHYSNLTSQHSMGVNISNNYPNNQSGVPPSHHSPHQASHHSPHQHPSPHQQATYTQLYYNMAPPQQRSSPTMHNIENTMNPITSDDSDDSTPLTNMMTGIKRPSPEPVESLPKIQTKKPKAQKKKKKKDPNEPQKPVSAYALFFRDTQAAIKGQNPNASFGEVSKIVASMWDSLDADHKNVYKKKTELAKKDYLKALAAYRASLVSKGGGEGDNMYPGGNYPGPGYGGGGGAGGGGFSGYSPPNNLPSPPLHQVNSPHMKQQQDPNSYNSQPMINNHINPQQSQAPPQQQQIPHNNNSYIHQVPTSQMSRGYY